MQAQDIAFNQFIFEKQVSALRRQSQQNMDARAAMNYLRSNGTQSGTFPRRDASPQTSSDENVLQRADVVVRELTDEEIDRRALFDESGVYNFRFTLRTLLDELTRCRTFNRPVTLMIVAIQNHRGLGEEFGALAFDSVVSSSAETLLDCCRPIDMVGRYMVDRFIIVLPETDLQSAFPIAEDIQQRLRSSIVKHQWPTVRWQAKIGLAQFPEHGYDAESLIALSDFAADEMSSQIESGIFIAPKL